MIRVEASRPTDWDALGRRWRALEPECDGSFFQSWTWVGCMAEARFPEPLLLEAFEGPRTVGLALFNRRRGRLHLNETGEAVLDSLTVEHNGVLAARDRADAVRAACYAAARRTARAVVLSGVGGADLRAAEASGAVRLRRTSPAPFVDLASVRASGRPYLETLSANTRYQVRRSDRRFEEQGPLVAARAPDPASALACLDELILLHEASWAARGKPGAFSRPAVRAFHRALIERGCARGEVDLWRVSAGRESVGRLYNFRYRERVMSYQSGFISDPAPHRKPGLSSHGRVIESYSEDSGLLLYDFLAGDHRYKLSLSSGAASLHWALMIRSWSREGIALKIRDSANYLKYYTSRRHVDHRG